MCQYLFRTSFPKNKSKITEFLYLSKNNKSEKGYCSAMYCFSSILIIVTGMGLSPSFQFTLATGLLILDAATNVSQYQASTNLFLLHLLLICGSFFKVITFNLIFHVNAFKFQKFRTILCDVFFHAFHIFDS